MTPTLETNVHPQPSQQVIFQSAPGTELLFHNVDEKGNDLVQGAAGKLVSVQHVEHGDRHLILVPQPSLTDPNDPLSWPAWLKWATFSNALAYAFMGGVTGPIMAAMMVPLSERFGESLQRITYANGATLVCQGLGNILWM